jgi:hypothetical protein
MLLSYGAMAQGTFNFGYLDVYSPNALNYVVQQQNIERSSEGGNPADGISYWNPVNNGTPAILTQEFTFSGPTTEISLYAEISVFNFDGNTGSGSLWASTDDVNWVELVNAPTTSSAEYTYIYNGNLPNSLLGANQIFIQTQLETSGDDIWGQFNRQDTSVNNGAGYNDGGNIFQLDANYTSAVPESSTVSLFGIGLAILAFASKGVKKSIA